MSEAGRSNRNCVEVVFSVVMALSVSSRSGGMRDTHDSACRLKDWTAYPADGSLARQRPGLKQPVRGAPGCCWQKEAFQTEPDIAIATPTIQLLHKEGV